VASAVWTQARPSVDQQQRCDRAPDSGVCRRCVLAAAAWLQGVRRLLAAWWFGKSRPVTIPRRSAVTIAPVEPRSADAGRSSASQH